MLTLTTEQQVAAANAIAGRAIGTERMNSWHYWMERRVRFELELCQAGAAAAGLDLAEASTADLEWLARTATMVVELAETQLHVQHRIILDGPELRAAIGRLI